MANLVLNRTCNQSCEFCFADNNDGPEFVVDDVLAHAKQLAEQGESWVSLVGGEPTLHREFPKIVASVAELGQGLRVFSNGRIPTAALEALVRLPAHRCTVVVNASAGDRAGDGLGLHRSPAALRSLRRLGPRASLGWTWSHEHDQPERCLEFYARYGLAPRFRVGLAQPVVGRPTKNLPDISAGWIGDRVTALAVAGHSLGVRLEFDCGFARCAFTRAQLDILDRLGSPLEGKCSAIPDLGADGRAFPCYPLAPIFSSPWRTSGQVVSDAHLRRCLDQKTRGFRRVGHLDACRSCPEFQTTCAGGCAARTVADFRRLEVVS